MLGVAFGAAFIFGMLLRKVKRIRERLRINLRCFMVSFSLAQLSKGVSVNRESS
jgi:hypothetical protein